MVQPWPPSDRRVRVRTYCVDVAVVITPARVMGAGSSDGRRFLRTSDGRVTIVAAGLEQPTVPPGTMWAEQSTGFDCPHRSGGLELYALVTRNCRQVAGRKCADRPAMMPGPPAGVCDCRTGLDRDLLGTRRQLSAAVMSGRSAGYASWRRPAPSVPGARNTGASRSTGRC